MMAGKNYDIKDEWFFEKQSSLVTIKVNNRDSLEAIRYGTGEI